MSLREIIQIDNATHYNAKKEREKALKVLEEAKKIKRKVIIVPQRFSFQFKKHKKKND